MKQYFTRAHTAVLPIIFCLGFGTYTLNAQKITGLIKDEKGVPLPMVSIQVWAFPDSVLKTGGTSESDGKFEVIVKDIKGFKVVFKLLGYKDYWYPKLVSQGANLGLITLNEQPVSTGAVEVVKKKPIMQAEAGKVTVDVGNTGVGTGLNALELLRKMPGVIADQNGNISLRGKNGVLIMIDDKPILMDNQQLVTLLQSTQASEIDKVELVTQPNSEYDAQGMAGIIHFKRKKGKAGAFNGEYNAQAGTGIYHRFNTGFTISKKTTSNQWNFGMDWGNNGNLMDITNDRQYPVRGIDFRNQLNSKYRYYNDGKLLRFAYAHNFKKWEVSLDANVRKNKAVFYAHHNSLNLTPEGRMTGFAQTDDYNPDDVWNHQYSGFVKYNTDSAGGSITLRSDLGILRQVSGQVFGLRFYNADSSFVGRGDRELNTDPSFMVSATRLDYVKPIKKGLLLKSGLKYTQVSAFNNNRFYDIIGGNRVADLLNTNKFDYSEKIYAAYGTVDFTSGSWIVNLGLRLEKWQAIGLLNKPNSNFERDLTWLFPTASISRSFEGGNSLSLSITRRINRPSYGKLNPYAFQMDAYTYYAGNPNLRPELNQGLELTYSLFEGMISVSLAASRAQNPIADDIPYRFSDTSLRMFVTPVNIPRQLNTAASVFGGYEILPGWNMDYYVSYFFNAFSGAVLGTELNNKRATLQANINNSITLSKNWSCELSGFYNGASAGNMALVKPFGQVNTGITRIIANGKGKISLIAQDLFWNQVFRQSVNTPLLRTVSTFRGDSRVVMLSFSYKFGLGKEDSPAKSTDEELKRMGR